jgi:hypothetical protein
MSTTIEKVERMVGSGGRPRHGAGGLALAALIGFALAAPPALGIGSTARKHEPDLVVAGAELKGEPYAFADERGAITVEDITKNVGSVRAGPSLTRVYLVHGAKRWLLTQRAVPALGPGREDRDEGSSPIYAPHAYPIGEYTLRICADAKNHVNESDELNNCGRLRPRRFFIAARSWSGSLGGIETGGLTDRWQSTNAQLNFDQYESGGVFSYLFSGAVTWTISGTTASGCTVSGTGTKSYESDASIGALKVDYLNANYTGGLQETGGPFFQVSFSNCPDGGTPPPPEAAPYEPDFWQTSFGSTIPLPFGTAALPGSPIQFAGATWHWSLQATHSEQ